MADKKEKRNSIRWGKPEKSEKLNGSELKHSLMNNGLTLLIAAIIIAAGIMLPTLIYPYIDSHNNRFVQLSEPTDSVALSPLPSENIALYPWNTYSENRTRYLSVEEYSKLEASGTAEFLTASLKNRGMQLDRDDGYYQQRILDSFRCLEPQSTDGTRFFVLYAGDVNEDQEADIRCLVDYDGKIISMLILSAHWETVQLTEPINATAGSGSTTVGGGGGTATGDDQTAEADGTVENTAAQNPDGSDVAAEPGASAEDDAATEATPQNTSPENYGSDVSAVILPAQEDRLIWDFSYTTSRQAYLVNQVDVFNAFRQLDLYFEGTYGYQYKQLIPNRTTEVEVIPNDTLYNSINPPVHYTDDDYQLNIYRLPNGVELILYLNPQNQHCVGFLIRQYTLTS